MVTCGHQLGSSNDCDWLFSSSVAAPIGGNADTAALLQSIIMADLFDPSEDNNEKSNQQQHQNFLQSKRIQLKVSSERENKFLKHRENRVTSRRGKIESFHDFSQFDEAEHIDGCPVKWLFRRQSTESWRSTTSRMKEEEESKGKKTVTIRDKIPREMQIRKIGLKRRQCRANPKGKQKKEDKKKKIKDESEKSVDEWKELIAREEKRAQLAAKLNFRPFGSEDDESEEEVRSLTNFLRPRPLTGQRPWLCVLLAPRLDVSQSLLLPKKMQSTIPERNLSPPTKMSVRSLTLPEIAKPRPKTTPLGSSAARWQKKKSPKTTPEKQYRSPPLLTIKLQGEVYPSSAANPLLEEDRFFRLRRFLNLDDKIQKDSVEIAPVVRKRKNVKSQSKDAIQVISCRAQFFERPGKPMR